MLNKQALLQAYRKMREIRTFEERLHHAFFCLDNDYFVRKISS